MDAIPVRTPRGDPAAVVDGGAGGLAAGLVGRACPESLETGAVGYEIGSVAEVAQVGTAAYLPDPEKAFSVQRGVGIEVPGEVGGVFHINFYNHLAVGCTLTLDAKLGRVRPVAIGP